jgi:mono/diheme cytochrome c family protein
MKVMFFARGLSRFFPGLLLLAAMTAQAQAANIQQGQRLARLYCVSCHAIDKVSPSPLVIARRRQAST